MRRRHDGNGGLRHVDAEREARRVDVWEVVDEKPLPEMPHVEEGAIVAAALQLRVDAARHDVAGRELASRIVALHEPLAG
jgi:hypothetical protein